MSISTIVAPMTGGGTDGPALDAALVMADPTKVHIQAICLHCDPKHTALPQVGEGMTSGMIDTLVEVAERQVGADRAAARACFDQWRRSNRIGEVETPAPTNGLTAHLTELQVEMTPSLTAIGRLADMVCMVQPAEDDDPVLSNLVTTALLETGKMLYLAPNGRPGTAIKHVATAWNGSREAARAVSLAMPILESADAVTVLAGTSDHLKPADAKAWMFAISGDLPGRLQAEAMDVGAQVLVFGA